jgi:hypothetical protein
METLEQLRGAIRLSLWTWTLYWPLAGLMLLAAGMTDLTSILVLGLLVATFLTLLVSGMLRSPGGARMRAFLKDRPIYLVAAAAAVLVGGSLVSAVASLGLALFALAYLGSMANILLRLRAHLQATGKGYVEGRGDQLALLLGMALLLSLPLAFDMLLQFLTPGETLGASTGAVAALNLFHIAYPPLLLLAARPFLATTPRAARQRFRYRIVREPVAAAAEADA